jgi:hypothetical protein
MDFDYFIRIWLLMILLLGLYARKPSARMTFPSLLPKFYTYCFLHAVFFRMVWPRPK